MSPYYSCMQMKPTTQVPSIHTPSTQSSFVSHSALEPELDAPELELSLLDPELDSSELELESQDSSSAQHAQSPGSNINAHKGGPDGSNVSSHCIKMSPTDAEPFGHDVDAVADQLSQPGSHVVVMSTVMLPPLRGFVAVHKSQSLSLN